MVTLPRRFRRNVVTTYLATAVAALQILLVTPLLVRGLGMERYGIWSLVVSFGLFAVLLDLGLASATVRYVAKYDALGERYLVVRTLATSFWLLLVLGLLALVAGTILAPLFPLLFHVVGSKTSASVLVLLTAASIAVTLVGGAFQGLLAGLQRYSALNLISVSAMVAQTALFAIALVLGGRLVALGAVLLSVSLAQQVARYWVVRRELPQATISPGLVTRQFSGEIARASLWLSSVHLSTALRYRVDTIVVGFVAGVRAAGIYAVGQMLFIAANRFIQPILTGFFPLSAELEGRDDREDLRAVMLTGTRIALAVAGPVCLAIILLAGPFLDSWVGSGFQNARLVVVYLVSALLLSTVSRTGLLMLQGAGKIRGPAAINWADALLNFVLSVVLGLAIGMTGVALATLIATATLSTMVGTIYVCRSFGVRTGAFLGSVGRAHLPPVGAALVTGWVVMPESDDGLIAVFTAGIAIVLAYLATLVVTGLEREERRRLWSVVRRADWRAAAAVRRAR